MPATEAGASAAVVRRAAAAFALHFDGAVKDAVQDAMLCSTDLSAALSSALLLKSGVLQPPLGQHAWPFSPGEQYGVQLAALAGDACAEGASPHDRALAALGCALVGLSSYLLARRSFLDQSSGVVQAALMGLSAEDLASTAASEDNRRATELFAEEQARLYRLVENTQPANVEEAIEKATKPGDKPAYPIRTKMLHKESAKDPIYDVAKGWNVRTQAPVPPASPSEEAAPRTKAESDYAEVEDMVQYAAVDQHSKKQARDLALYVQVVKPPPQQPPPLPRRQSRPPEPLPSYARLSPTQRSAAPPGSAHPLGGQGRVPWYHGAISRDAADKRMRRYSAAAPGHCVYLVRNRTGERDDLVLSCQRVDAQSRGRAILHVPIQVNRDQRGRPVTFTFVAPFIPNPPHLHNLQAGIDFLRSPYGEGRYWLPLGPPEVPVPAPANAGTDTAPTQLGTATAPRSSRPQWIEDDEGDPSDPLIQPQIVTALQAPLIVLQRAPEPPAVKLLCEGYLVKCRGFGQNRKRWFVLTTEALSFFTRDSADVIDTVKPDSIAAVVDIDKTHLRLLTKTPFGATHNTEMALEAPSQKVKAKWLQSLKALKDLRLPAMELKGVLLAEGYMSKLAPFGSTNRTRWFRLTTQQFAIYKEEEGERMALLDLEHITTVGTDPSHRRTFRLLANQKFTAGGHNEVLCKCESNSVRNRWIVALRQIVPHHKFQR